MGEKTLVYITVRPIYASIYQVAIWPLTKKTGTCLWEYRYNMEDDSTRYVAYDQLATVTIKHNNDWKIVLPPGI